MKKYFSVLFVILVGLGAKAEKCVSGDLEANIQEIQAANLGEETTQVEIYGAKIAKLSEIIACSAMRQSISKKDSEFAINQLQIQRGQSLQKIEQNRLSYVTELQRPDLSEGARETYEWALLDIRLRVEEENQNTEAVIAGIKKQTH